MTAFGVTSGAYTAPATTGAASAGLGAAGTLGIIGAAIGVGLGAWQAVEQNRSVREAARRSMFQIQRSKVDAMSIRSDQSNMLLGAIETVAHSNPGATNIMEILAQAQADGVLDIRQIIANHNAKIEAVRAQAKASMTPVWLGALTMGMQGLSAGAGLGSALTPTAGGA